MASWTPLAGLYVLDRGHDDAATAACARILRQLGAHVECEIDPDDAAMVLVDGAADEMPSVVAAEAGHGTVFVSIRPDRRRASSAELGGIPWSGIPEPVQPALVGAHAAVAALAAWHWPGRRHETRTVEIAAVEVLATCLGDALPRELCGVSGQAAGPHVRALPCADGFVGVAVPVDVDRLHALAMVGGSSLDHLDVELGAWLGSRTRAEAVQEAQAWRLPFVPVRVPAEAPRTSDALFGFSPEQYGPARTDTSPHTAQRTRETRTALPLSDLRVLDLGMVWAGPYAGRLLAGLGAEVVKVEGPGRPDGTRKAYPNCFGLFADLNRGKQSLVVDLARSEGRALFARVVRTADALIENFSPRVMPNFGLAYRDLARLRDDLVMLSLPARAGENFVSYGGGLELAAGLAIWPQGKAPVAAPVPYLDYLAGAYGAAALIAAVALRDRTGRGGRIELAQASVAAQLLSLTSDRTWPRDALAIDAASALRDPGLQARGFFADGAEGHHYARLPWQFGGIRPRAEASAPGFGADTARILRDLAGVQAGELASLASDGVVVCASSGSA